MKRIFGILGILFLLNINLTAQLRHGAHVLAGMSKIQLSNTIVYPEPTISEVLNNFDLSFIIGYEGSFAKENGFAMQFGLDALRLNAKIAESIYTSDLDFTNIDSELKAWYVGIPVLAGFKRENIAILTGIRASFFVNGSMESITMGKEDGVDIMNTVSDSLFKLDGVDLGHHTELNYGLGENMEVVLSYYYGFGTFSNKSEAGNYYQQLSIGLAFLFN